MSWFILSYNLDICSEYVFVSNTEMSVTSPLTKQINTKSRGRWQMWVHGVQVPEDTPDVQVVVFGTEGKSSSQKVQNLNDNPFLVGFFFLSRKFYRSVTVK